jgi:hypothetical protein
MTRGRCDLFNYMSEYFQRRTKQNHHHEVDLHIRIEFKTQEFSKMNAQCLLVHPNAECSYYIDLQIC